MSTNDLHRNRPANGRWHLIFGAWLIALVAALAAVFIGEVMGYVPCVLCWYQRIAMFPLPLILGAALLSGDPGVVRYSLPLAAVGGFIAA